MTSFNLIDHSKEALDSLEQAKKRSLESIGIKAEKYAKALCPVDTGNLRNSISHADDGQSAYIGTNVEYAPYQELGTSTGVKPKHFLKFAAENHSDEYKDIIRRNMSGL